MVDLPVSREITSPTSATMGIGKTKTQFYGRNSFGSNLNLTFGQFDTLFGLELNDSKDRVFGNTRLAYEQTLPVAHSGAYLTYSGNGITARLLAAQIVRRSALMPPTYQQNMEPLSAILTLCFAASLDTSLAL